MEKKDWVLPNRFLFPRWFYQHFHPSQYVSSEKGYFTPDSSQKLIRDFMHYDSPYRGILVYHGLGTGKSCTSILATDSFVSHHSKVVVILPASLEMNYRKELTKCSSTGSFLRKKWSLVQLNIKNDMAEIESLHKFLGITRSFISERKGKVWLPSLPRGFPASKVVQKDVFLRSMEEPDAKAARETYQHMIDQRYTFLHYNGLTNKKLDQIEEKDDYGEDIFDNAFVVIDEVHTFISRVVNGGKIARRLYNLLISKPNIKLALLSGTPVINQPFELCYTLNLLRGPIREYTIQTLKGKELPPVEEIVEYLQKQKFYPHVDLLEMDAGNKHLHLTILPKGFVRKEKEGPELVKGPLFKDEQTLLSKIVKSLKKKFPVKEEFKTEEFTALPDHRDEFINYFFDMTDRENPKINLENKDLFMRRIQGIVSYYRVADEELFPKALEPMYKPIQMSKQQYSYYVDVRNDEITKEDIKKKKENKRRATGEDMFKTNSSYRAYSRMACNFVFPEAIPRPFPKDIRGKILRREIDIQEEDDMEEGEEKQTTRGTINQDKLYEKELKEALQKLQNQGDKYLTGKGLYECSPKMFTLLNDITTNSAKSLLYSQFRTVEGLRIFRMVLDKAGWKEIDFTSLGEGDWSIVNAEEVLQETYNKKRYLVFGDKEKTEMLLNVFNADRKNLPKTIQHQLQKANLTENLRGELASLLMITQSGAEGLNLRNVRYVYILEPFWNQVRIDQVIGRAIRKGSHLELPENERNVQVVMYLSTFTPKQATSNKTIKFRDDSKTTDENIRELAQKKDKIIQQFLTMLKSNAVDCIFHASKNKPLQFGYKCYMPPINQDLSKESYVPNLEEDRKHASFGVRERPRKIQGKAVEKKKKKYVKLEEDDTLYDYSAYKDAGVLVPSPESS